MAGFDEVGALMRDIGPAAGFAAIQAFAEERAWLIAVDEETVLGADLDGARGVLVLSADVGVPDPKAADRINRLALIYGRAWYANDGSYLGLDPDTGVLRLFTTVAVDGVEAGELGARIIDFSVRVDGWKSVVAAPAGGSQDALEEMAREGVFRV